MYQFNFLHSSFVRISEGVCEGREEFWAHALFSVTTAASTLQEGCRNACICSTAMAGTIIVQRHHVDLHCMLLTYSVFDFLFIIGGGPVRGLLCTSDAISAATTERPISKSSSETSPGHLRRCQKRTVTSNFRPTRRPINSSLSTRISVLHSTTVAEIRARL